MSDSEEDFSRVFVWVLASLVLFTIVVMLLARSIGLDENSGSMSEKDIDTRTAPYGTVKVAGVEENSAEATPAVAEATPAVAEATPAVAEVAPAVAEVTAPSGDAATGEATFNSKGCSGCHGMGGHSLIPTNPVLAGKDAGFISKQLADFKNGSRQNPMMNSMAAMLSDSDIANIAAYLSKQ